MSELGKMVFWHADLSKISLSATQNIILMVTQHISYYRISELNMKPRMLLIICTRKVHTFAFKYFMSQKMLNDLAKSNQTSSSVLGLSPLIIIIKKKQKQQKNPSIWFLFLFHHKAYNNNNNKKNITLCSLRKL